MCNPFVIDVLITAAGIYTGSPLTEVSLQQWQRLIDINLTGQAIEVDGGLVMS